MNIYLFFIANFSGVFLAAGIIAYVFIWPNIQNLPKNRQLAVCLSPQMFRLMAIGLLHPILSPGLSMEFAIPTVIVDIIVSLLAMSTVLLLHHNQSKGQVLAIITVVLGSLHILISGYYAPRYEFPQHLHTQWLIPVIFGPIMLVSIILSLTVLLKHE